MNKIFYHCHAEFISASRFLKNKILKQVQDDTNVERGFTLIELLAVIAILSVVGSIISVIIFTSLRGTQKANTITTVRQNGYYALAQMSKMLREARRLNTPSSCVLPPSPTPIPTFSTFDVTSDDGMTTTFTCIPGQTISSNSASLLDTQAVTVVTCSFSCSQTSISDVPIVTIDFSLQANRSGGIQLFAERIASGAPIPFKTSIVLRNINR